MADMMGAKNLARKRLEVAERESMVHEMGTEAQHALLAERERHKEYIGQLDELSEPQKRVLVHLMESGIVSRAAFEAQVGYTTVWNWIRESELFKDMVDECKRFANDRLEQVAIDLATGRYMKPVVSQGRIAAYERIYDAKVLLAMLKSRKPAEFAQRIDVTSNGQSLVKLVDKDAWDAV